MSNSAGKAARAKNASEAADQIEVAKVLKPMGLSINVAGNSFITSRKTKAHPASIPGRAMGSVTEENARRGLLPRLLAASSILGLICSSEVRTAPMAGDRKSTTYARSNSPVVWYKGGAYLAPKNTSASAMAIPGRANPT